MKKQSGLSEVVRKVLEQELKPLIGETGTASLNTEFLNRHNNSHPHRVASKYVEHLILNCPGS